MATSMTAQCRERTVELTLLHERPHLDTTFRADHPDRDSIRRIAQPARKAGVSKMSLQEQRTCDYFVYPLSQEHLEHVSCSHVFCRD